jgi:hypothetical protein
VNGDGDRDGPGDAVPGEREDRPDLDIDAAFAAIVADFGRAPAAGVGPWPAAEDVDPDAPDAPDAPDLPDAPAGTTVLPDPGRLRPLQRSPRHRLPDDGTVPADGGTAPAGADDDPTERFVPPEPPPITSTDLASRLAWLGVLGGPLVLLLAALAWSRLPTYVVILALAAFVGGFVTLVARLPRDRDDGSDDDGAVV